MRKDGENTRQRILCAASRLFAEKGYRGTTHEQIVRMAKVNTAAINYHFRSKESLYVEAWRTSFTRLLEKHPADGGVPQDASAEERLHGMILSIMHRVSDPENNVFDIIEKERANPTGILTDTIEKHIKPIRSGIESIVRELLGSGASENDVQLCRMSIMSQAFRSMARRRQNSANSRARRSVLDEMGIEDIADHVTRFSIDGIAGVRKRLEKSRRQ